MRQSLQYQTSGNRFEHGVRNVKCATLAHPPKPCFIDTDLDHANRYGTKVGPRKRNVAFDQSQHHVINPTNSRRALYDSVEDRLHIRRRAANDAEHFGRCRLMLQRLAQFRVAFLQFFE